MMGVRDWDPVTFLLSLASIWMWVLAGRFFMWKEASLSKGVVDVSLSSSAMEGRGSKFVLKKCHLCCRWAWLSLHLRMFFLIRV